MSIDEAGALKIPTTQGARVIMLYLKTVTRNQTYPGVRKVKNGKNLYWILYQITRNLVHKRPSLREK